ncbi:MAG: hypothetical protein NPIRA06_18870 [Nitrospirales bacterium]|nr:MAG: hypothetical protein NPIRA06_18870 [Nitrospirales bacterium]
MSHLNFARLPRRCKEAQRAGIQVYLTKLNRKTQLGQIVMPIMPSKQPTEVAYEGTLNILHSLKDDHTVNQESSSL